MGKCVLVATCLATLWLGSPASAAAQAVTESGRREALRRYRAGEEMLRAERFERAAQEFSAAVRLDPLLLLAHYGLGHSRMALRQYPEAIDAYTRCRDAFAALARLARSNRGLVEDRVSDEVRELREALRLARRAQTGSAGGFHEHRVEARLRDLERWRHSWMVSVVMPAELSLSLGSAYFRDGQLQAAEREWDTAVTVDPTLGEAHNNLAVVYMMSGRRQQAENAIAAAERSGFRVDPRLKGDVALMAGQ